MELGISFVAYDTVCSIRVNSEKVEQELKELLSSCERVARKVETTLNMYDDSSELSRLCLDYKPGEKYRVSKLLYDFLEMNRFFYEKTGGVFDPTIGPIVRLWDFLSDAPRIPASSEIEMLRQKVGYNHVRLHPDTCSVSFDIDGIRIDPGASGKGYALKLVADLLKKNGVFQAVLDFGGNMYALGGKTGTEGEVFPWKVAILDPENTETYIGTAELKDTGIATSSWYEHSFTKDGKVYHHLIDPRNGYPKPLDVSSVSIVSSNAAFTDFLSTAVFLLGLEEGSGLLERIRKETNETVGAVIVTKEGSVTVDHCVFNPKRRG